MANLKNDLTGKWVGKLFIIEEKSVPYVRLSERRKTIRKVTVRCACGNIFTTYKYNITSGKSKSCLRCGKTGNLVGNKIGSVTVLERDITKKVPAYICLCECGNKESLFTRYLRHGESPARCSKCRYPKKYKPKRTVKEVLAERGLKKHEATRDKLIGTKPGNVRVIAFSHWKMSGKVRRPWYLVQCSCGKKFTIKNSWIPHVKGCGCNSYKKPKNYVFPSAKLTRSEILAVRQMISSNMYTQRKIASIFNVTESLISAIKRRKTHKDVM